VIGIFNILVASVAARMLGDEFLAAVNYDSLGFTISDRKEAGEKTNKSRELDRIQGVRIFLGFPPDLPMTSDT
jgi:hypothetical protein